MSECNRTTPELVWLLAALITPLAVNPWGCVPFEAVKTAGLQALVGLLGVAALAQLVYNRRNRWAAGQPARVLVWPALALGLALSAATLWSVDPRLSLWGSFERRQGLITLGAYLLLFYLVARDLHTPRQVARLLTVLSWASAPVVLYGLCQAAGWDAFAWHSDAASSVLATLGRANFLGSYLVLVIPLTLMQLLFRWPVRRIHSLAYGLLLAGQLACLVLTQARGAWLGAGIALAAFTWLWLLTAPGRRRIWTGLGLTLAGLGLVALLIWPAGPLSRLAVLPGFERLANLAAFDSGSQAARLNIWQTSLPLVFRRPWLGYGPETMWQVFAPAFPPQLVYYQGRHVLVDRAHNVWLDLALSAGLPGVLAFGALIGAFTWLLWRRLHSSAAAWQRLVWIGLGAAVFGHMADLQVGFDLTASATVFWLCLAMAAALGGPDRLDTLPLAAARDVRHLPAAAPHAGEGRRWLPWLPPVLAGLALIGTICVRPLWADVACWLATQPDRPLSDRLAAAQQAVRLWPVEPEYRLRLAFLALAAGQPVVAWAQADAATALSRRDPRLWAAQGDLYALWGEREAASYARAEAAYRQALTLAPDIATYHLALGLVLARQGRLEEATAELERAVDLDATDSLAYTRLAELYQASGRPERAAWAYDQAEYWFKRTGGSEMPMRR